MTEESSAWYSSHYRGGYNWKENKREILHEKPLRCPYCGHVMDFIHWTGYEIHSRDWYWQCFKCKLKAPNLRDFSKDELDSYRRNYRKYLEKAMREAKEKLNRLKNLYNQYGLYFTPEEKRDRLIETIEEHKLISEEE